MDNATRRRGRNKKPTAAMLAAEAAFRSRLIQFGAVLLESYRGSQDKHHVRCRAGHDCYPRPNSLRSGQGPCLTCAGQNPATAEARFRAVLADLGAVPLYEKWAGSDKRYLVRCAAGHECKPRPSDAFRWGTICTVCSGKSPAVSEANFRSRLAELGATPLYEAWHGCNEPHHARCTEGHDCYPRPSDVAQGHGACRFCVGDAWDAFYVVTGNGVVKFGITSGDPRPRLRIHAAQGYTGIVRLAIDLPGTVAPDTERAVKSALAMAGETPIQGREYFDVSCLALILDVADSWLSTAEGPADASGDVGTIREWVQDILFAA